MIKKPKIVRNLQDRFLSSKSKAGNTEAYTIFYRRYAKDIFKFLRFKVPAPELAEDLTQEVFLKVWKYVSQGRQIDNIRALLYQTARNLAIDYYRRKKLILFDEDEQKEIASDENMQKEIEFKDDLQGVKVALKKLKKEYQEVIILRYVQEFSDKEIARVTDNRIGTVRVLMHRALKALKQQLKGAI
ncbi:MAG: RNA polymerase sigma factor [Patescibacteria group bacterium]